MTAKQVCEELGISMVTLHRRIKSGELKPAPKPPLLRRHYRLLFERADIDRLRQQST